jgi:transcriptional regulator with XRE-family HTH domain
LKNLRDLLAYNMKENRNRLGLSQARLAERSGLSTQYIAMIELTRKFPTPEMLERIASALEIDPPELFSMQIAEAQIRKFKKNVLTDIEKAVSGAVMQVIERNLEELETSDNCVNKLNCNDSQQPVTPE